MRTPTFSCACQRQEEHSVILTSHRGHLKNKALRDFFTRFSLCGSNDTPECVSYEAERKEVCITSLFYSPK
jgi:hypothetical protein